ncbi:Asp-tRNA(Asn)/Glu-tRNA(Gln) amidotransferase subunit GatA [Rapidithrix thailandica]|uniref:Glutamyl-tRNA(Gln) amidotransferase subunit A n=1 Tax=Rapidithrix thailandica TaxID=413964 RepID=A0AAW9S7K7_9BACT
MYSSFQKTQAAVLNGELSCREVVEYFLRNIEQKKHLNIFLEVYQQEALERAEAIDQKIADGTQGRLAGMVLGIKDVLCYQGHPLQAASQILNGFEAQFTATAVQRLLDEDVIIIGRQNCDEFAMGSSNENSSFGPTLNPVDETKVPGGSSGASAAAVAVGLCHASLGSDTGGSVRQPASFCGVVGLKPTYSRISRWGLIAYASSFDTIGILSHTVEEAALLLEVMAGQDEFDSTVSQREVPAYAQKLSLERPLKVGYIKETIESEGIDSEVKQKTLDRIEFLKQAGHEVKEVTFPLLEYVLPTYYILTTAEASTNLERYDGVKFGYRTPEATDLETMYKRTRSEGFGAEVQRRIMLGTFVLSASYYDAYFTKAQKVRRLIAEQTKALFKELDFLILPTAPTPPFEIGKYGEENLIEYYLADLFTVQASVSGIPAISIPNGTSETGLPIGLQIMANAFNEDKLLAFAKYLL